MEVSRAIASLGGPLPLAPLHRRAAPLHRRAAPSAADRRSSGRPSLPPRPLRTSLSASPLRLPARPTCAHHEGPCCASGPRGSRGAQPGREGQWGPWQGEVERVSARGGRRGVVARAAGGGGGDEELGAGQSGDGLDAVLSKAVWAGFGIYMLWLFVLPYAPGDPAWSISEATVQEVKDLSLNFFYVLPALNAGELPVQYKSR
ncbi:hypothetical protein CLOM_g925 [Closterium sp. NIES-68]|nr:hypothetical protein CLOM_g925 [Closterium sp. NIES-68]